MSDVRFVDHSYSDHGRQTHLKDLAQVSSSEIDNRWQIADVRIAVHGYSDDGRRTHWKFKRKYQDQKQRSDCRDQIADYETSDVRTTDSLEVQAQESSPRVKIIFKVPKVGAKCKLKVENRLRQTIDHVSQL